MSDLILTQTVDSARLKQDTGALLKEHVTQFMVDVVHDRLFHAEVVAAGPFQFRHAFAKEFGPLFLNNRMHCDQLADITHQFFVGQWRQKYRDRNSSTFDGLSAEDFLNKVEIKSPPTQEELEDDLTIEIASSEEAMQRFYVGSARVRKGRDAFSTFWHRSPDDILKSMKKARNR